MESTSDGMARQGICFSSMKQPPLLKLLKGILSEYPDGGQILKELIQNAEDAGANQVRIMYDGRRINNDMSDTTPMYNKFFKGPALCVYNNAVFSEEDWEGIQMIYSSKKERNPLKVGRFGLGFKSVFHITDYPCLISCNKLLMIDPQQPTERVNALVDLCMVGKLEEEGLNSDAFWTALEDTFGLSTEHVQGGYFPGTLFWFPLRETSSALSDTLYDETKIKDLFQGFQSETSSIVLFLKHLEEISMWIRGNDKQSKEYSKVAIQDSDGIVRKRRLEFKENIESIVKVSQSDRDDLKNSMQMKIEVTAPGMNKRYEWLVVNYFVGKSASADFMSLINDENLAYSPYVGVAAPLHASPEDREGHVFCFLPLPREGPLSTGLPVHVNGFFALSQNRHHLKWETEDQEGNKIDDKSILWNKYLLREALPLAYAHLVTILTERSNKLGNTSESVADVYSCLPLSVKTQHRWSVLEAGVYEKLKTICFLFTSYNKSWISLSDAFFATFSNLPESHSSVQDAVIRCLYQIGKCHVKIKTDLFITIQKYAPESKDLSPQIAVICLQENQQYRKMDVSDKLDILAYLLSDSGDYEILNGLELLPLASGEFTCFKRSGEPIFACSENVMKILPGVEGRLLMRTSGPLANSLNRLCSLGFFQVKEMSTTDVKTLLEMTLNNNFGSTNDCRLTLSTSLTAEWLYDVWNFILHAEETELDSFANLQVVPVLKEGTWLVPERIDLVKLSDLLLVKSCDGEDLPDSISSCFEMMGVTVLQSLPSWIPVDKVKQYFYWPTQKSIIALLSKINDTRDLRKTVAAFNTSCETTDKHDLLKYFVKCQSEITPEARNLMRHLHLFRIVEFISGPGKNGSVSECQNCISGTESYSKKVALPFPCLVADFGSESLLKCLGGRTVLLDELVIMVLRRFQQNDEDVQVFMEYFVKNFHLFKNNPAIVSAAQNVPFLRTCDDSSTHKASELFDPSDSKIRDLLYDESLIPERNQLMTNEVIVTLKCLGLKNSSDIDADILFKVAKTLDNCARKKCEDNSFIKKAVAFMELLSLKPYVLHERCSTGKQLKYYLSSLSCICVQRETISPYPKCLEWYEHEFELCRPTEAKEVQMCLLVGSSMPTVVCSSDGLNKVFNWKQSPPLGKVIEQLQMVRKYFSVQCRSEVMPAIKAIYDHINSNLEKASTYKSLFVHEELLWTGQEFVSADRVTIIKREDDVDLRPYFFSISSEYDRFQTLFSKVGCRNEQDALLLQETLRLIKSEHNKPQQEQIVKRDRLMVRAILEKLAKAFRQQNLTLDESQLLMMVHGRCEDTISLHPVSECTYDDDPACFSEADDNVFLVHEMIPLNIAEELGVKSITQKAVLDAEELGVQEWGQKERLTTRIHTLLRDAYTDGLSVPKELIQNADDAGASEVKFLYDERINKESRERVLSKGMRGFQGPALWVYNNKTFSDDDLQNITKLNAGTKQTDSKKIGKFGLGFCTVYNLTDLPSFVTGSNIVFFDPHEKHLGSVVRNKGTGLKYKLPNRTLVSRHIDQFKPYSGIFDCNIMDFPSTGYNGTLFRLPLRTAEQAKNSEIYKASYTHDEMIELIQMIIRAAGNMLLFTQNVQSIEIYHLAETADETTDPELLYEIQKECLKLDTNRMIPLCESVLSRLPDMLQKNQGFQEIQRCSFKQAVFGKCKTMTGMVEIPEQSQMSWIVSWASGNNKSLEMYNVLSSENALPVSAVAIPCYMPEKLTPCSLAGVTNCFYSKGHVFCFLPLPLTTGLPFHINGCFAVTSDRRQLVSITEDDKDCSHKNWNNALMEDALVNSYIYLLETLGSATVDSSYKYYSLWPVKCENTVLPFKQAFYRHIIETNAKVFYGGVSLISFPDVIFLDPKIRQGPLGDLMFHVVSNFTVRADKTVIEMPDEILDNIINSNEDKAEYIKSAAIYERELCLLILRNVNDEFWSDKLDSRNQVLHFSLTLSDSVVNAEIQMTSCIPTEPLNELRKPSELIDPQCKIAVLFSETDGRFPLKTNGFRDSQILASLTEIGMVSKILPNDLLLDRCHSIPKIAESCHNCAFDRCRKVMKYISNEKVLIQLEQDINTLNAISDLNMFPILPKPKGWAFSWKADCKVNTQNQCLIRHYHQTQHFFGKSKELFRQNVCDLVGTVECVADESVFETKFGNIPRIMSNLRIKGENEIQQGSLVSQMKHIAAEYKNSRNQFEELKRLHRSLFRHFENVLKVANEKGHSLSDLAQLCRVPVVLIDLDLVKTSNVAFDVKEEYRPLLYKVPLYDRVIFRATYIFLGVKEYFGIEDVLDAFVVLKGSWGLNPSADVENANALLKNLQFSLEMSNVRYESIPDIHERIYAPDVSCELLPTKELVIENDQFETSASMKILHHGILPSVAESLGVKAKEMKCFEDISVGIAFGQTEKLGTRIKGLLKAYPCDSSIMNELLQNADDAGATEINFVKDYRNHPTNRLFSKSCEPFQGPSLCVYNNSYFTEKDIQGIHNLGEGSKNEDPTKTGQYGVGFNSVYHLTDTPSFFTRGLGDSHNGILIFLDPLCNHVPKANILNPGQMCSFDGVKKNFYDHLHGFSHEVLLHGENGTIFRFPLRTKQSEISKEEVSQDRMDEILSSFQKDMYDAILFLKNINCIKISNITSGSLIEEYSVHVKLDDDADKKRTVFNNRVRDSVKENRNNKELNLEIPPFQTVYEFEVSDSERFSKRWAVVQRFGFFGSAENLEIIKEKVRDGDIGQLPLGGVALPLSNSQNNKSQAVPFMTTETAITARAFCFLPLPLRTGFPLHVNGHFVLDHEARRNIGEEGYKKQWNYCLANEVIIPAWIFGLLHLQTYIQEKICEANTWGDVHQILTHYHTMFPVQDKTYGEFWNDLICNFYKIVLKQKASIFPCLFDTKSEFIPPKQYVNGSDARFCLLWNFVSTQTDKCLNFGVFNNIENYLPPSLSRLPFHLIENLLKSFGLKLLSTPSWIWHMFPRSGISNVPISTPDLVIEYLQLNTCSDERCIVGQLNTDISHTKYISSSNLKVFVAFLCRGKQFYKRLQGLPILLTSDAVLRECSTEYPVYVSEFSQLLPQSANYFIHEDVRTLFDDQDAFASNCFKQLHMDDFVKLLPDNLDPLIFAAGKNVSLVSNGCNDRNFISQVWLCLFFDFLASRSSTAGVDNMSFRNHHIPLNQTLDVDTSIDTFRRNISLFNKWSFLPCVKPNMVPESKTMLLKLSEVSHIVHFSENCLQDESGKSFQKLALPELDVSTFQDCKYAATITALMKDIVASPERPNVMLECLEYHQKSLEDLDMEPGDAINILAFFARHLEAMRTDHYGNLQRQFKLLPFFLTQQDSLTSIAGRTEVIILPGGIPPVGIQEWADACCITLLKKNFSLQSLYGFLGLKQSEIDEVYAIKILPEFTYIPSSDWMAHINFLRKRLINKRVLTEMEQRMVKELTSLRFISVTGEMKRANELYSPINEVFACMLDKACFPPNSLLAYGWFEFLVILGLNCKVNNSLLIRFASEIESQGRSRLSEEVQDKAEKLMKCFLTNNGKQWSLSSLSIIKKIRFIVPYKVTDQMSKIAPQIDNAQRLVCLENAISEEHKMLCWTSMSLVKKTDFEKLNSSVRQQVGITEQPPIDRVILHCQNICDKFKTLLKTDGVDKEFVKKQMKRFYEYFNDNLCSLDHRVISRLMFTPIVYLPEDGEIVTVKEVVIELQKDQQIKPYLYTAPVHYGEFFQLFQKLGCRKYVDFCHYARVLDILHRESSGKELNLQEKSIARKAIGRIFTSMSFINHNANKCERLYLPNRDMVLTNAKDLVVSDRISFESRLNGKANISFFVGFTSMNIAIDDSARVIRQLPDNIRPLLLTEVVTESICWDVMLEVENSIKARNIERLLHSEYLAHGLFRILKGQFHQSTEKIDNSHLVEIKKRLKNISVRQVSNIKTVLLYNNALVEGSDKDMRFYTKFADEIGCQKKIFYFKDESEFKKTNIKRLLPELTKLVLSCVDRLGALSALHIPTMLQEIDNPEMISCVLDDIGVPQFDMPQPNLIEHFPKPGTAVDPKFFPFLEQGIYPFKDYEYESVAMDLDDKVADDDIDDIQDPVYIYVQIISDRSKPNCSNLSHVYVVNTGNPDITSEIIPIYRLFRFVRKKEEPGNALQRYGDEPVFSLPFDENCKRIRDELKEAWNLSEEDRKRVTRRLYLKWYPDRNPENRAYCAEVFMYIKAILSRLENKEELSVDFRAEISRGPSNFSSSSFYYANVHRRAEAFVQAYNNNIDEYNRSYRRRQGLFSHAQEARAKRQDVTEAKRWLRQAKCDFSAAKAFMSVADGVDGYNWICYTCHQACEKALKSAYYARDADNVPRGSGSHNLSYLASDDDMRKQARLLEERLGDHTRLRYPDALSRPKTPSDIFKREDAEFAINIAEEMINLVQDFIS